MKHPSQSLENLLKGNPKVHFNNVRLIHPIETLWLDINSHTDQQEWSIHQCCEPNLTPGSN